MAAGPAAFLIFANLVKKTHSGVFSRGYFANFAAHPILENHSQQLFMVKMKNILVDFSHYDAMCGFGEIARNYAPRLAAYRNPGVHYIFALPKAFHGSFGDHITYIDSADRKGEVRRLQMPIDLWHATDQQFHYRRRAKGTIQLLTIHDLNFLREKHGVHRLRHVLQMQWRICHSDYITAISKFVRDDVTRHYPAALQKGMEVIYNGIGDDARGEQQRPPFVADDGERFFFTIGQIREKKNFGLLVPMMHYLPGYKLYICGDDHYAYARELRQLIDRVGEGRVVLTGKITDAQKSWLYAHCAAFLFPSRLEGFGIPVLEAMRYRTKVFCSNLSSLPEVCGPHADYWTDFSPEAMAAVVSRGLDGWSRDGQAAVEAEAYSRQFNYDTYTARYVALYRRLLHL
jgi:glycosyltransferase involved in cell wall biosynthesis